MNIQNSPLWRVVFIVILVIFGVVSCGDDDDDDNNAVTTSQGTFNDGPVQGLDYSSGQKSGQTDSNGTFEIDGAFGQGTKITFSVGDIEIGTGEAKPFMTPIDLVSGAMDENNDTVTNIVRFLLTLDEDADPSNGIQIPTSAATASIGLSINFNQTPSEFENDPNVMMVIASLTSNSLVSAEDAQAELRSTILGKLAGTYSGTFDGDATGTWQIDIDDMGGITGTFVVDGLPAGPITVPLTGSLPTNGTFTLEASLVTFVLTLTGTVTLDESVTGEWALEDTATMSTYMGTFANVTGGAGTGDFATCEVQSSAGLLQGRMVRFELTPVGASEVINVDVCAAFECQGTILACALQVFDIPGSAFFQFLTLSSSSFSVDNSQCLGFDFFIDVPGLGFEVGAFGAPLEGRNFGADTVPFASGEYAQAVEQTDGTISIEGPPLGTFRFFEHAGDDGGFSGFTIPTQECPE